MAGELIKTVDTNVNKMDDLGSVPDLLQKVISSDNDNVARAIQNEFRPGLLGKIWPSPIQRRYNELLVRQMDSTFEIREKCISLYIDMQLELARRAGDKLIIQKTKQWESELMELGMDISAHLTAVSQKNLSKIYAEFETSKRDFIERMKREDKEAEACKEVSFLYDDYRDNLLYESKTFFRIIRANLEKFEASLDISLQEALRQFTTKE